MGFPLYIHDGFDLMRFSDFVANRTDFVVQDHHSYFVYTPSDVAESASGHIQDVHDSVAQDLSRASDHQRRNLVVDEFSCALTDQSLAGDPNPDQARRDFCEGQMEIYQNETAGWAFWGQCLADNTCELFTYIRSLRQGGLLRRRRMVLQGRGWEEPSLHILLVWSGAPYRSVSHTGSVGHGVRDGLPFVRHDLHVQ